MRTVAWLLLAQGALGAFDTLYYHEWRARLPLGDGLKRRELALHAVRSIIYSVIFGTLPWIAWSGAWAIVLALLLAAEVVVTMIDFVAEDAVRAPLGGVLAGERVTHAIMGIVHGAMLAFLLPELLEWRRAPAGLPFLPIDVPPPLRVALTVLGLGVLASGLRDAACAAGSRAAAWPWRLA